MIATTATQERVVDTRFSYYNDDCIHVMRFDLDGERYFYAVDREFTSIAPTRYSFAAALIDGRRYLGRFRPECYCTDDCAACTSVHVRAWRRYRAAHPVTEALTA